MALTGIASSVQQKFTEQLQSKAGAQGQEGFGGASSHAGMGQSPEHAATAQGPQVSAAGSVQPQQPITQTQEAQFRQALQNVPAAAPPEGASGVQTQNFYLHPPTPSAAVQPGNLSTANANYFHRVAPVQSVEHVPIQASSYNPAQNQQTLGDRILNNILSTDQHFNAVQNIAQNIGTQSGQFAHLLQAQMDLVKMTETAGVSSTATGHTEQGVQSLEKLQ